ncbi:glutamate decarboxylase [Colletotrichum orchidophilum]|uniref:Glutamate decarboxylase n=1 Tax=Colletotrichum orchidophilum TaxID=1209926 RepID=A0A1G4BTB3_9PEZI|nr:glutamate decarboxylase [Colletotrichum orchidophilum]OHF04595.1 glutamate decarboxylase [Colletotrichum orchidophilum]
MTGSGPSVQDTTEPFVGAGGPVGIVGTWVGHDGQSRLTKESQDPLLFLKDRAPTPKRLQNLLRVVDGVLNAPRQPASFYRNLWSTHSHCIFSDADPAQTRIARLLTGIKHIDQESQRFESAGRISLVFLAHDIEVVKDQDLIMAPGQTRQNVAVLSIAQQLRVDCNEIKNKWRRGRNYIKLLERCGPASLLELGTGVNWYWEKALTKEDVDIFIEFFEAKLPHLSSRVKELNEAAGNMFVDGMLAYGWTLESLFGTNSRLCQALALHCPGLFRTPPRPFQDPRTWESLKTTDGSRGLVLDVTTSKEHARPNEFTDLAEHPIEQLSRFYINANPKQSPDQVYRCLRDELDQDHSPHFNLATFNSTYMEPIVARLMTENLAKNLVDPRAYPAVARIEQRCLHILADLYHMPRHAAAEVVGVSTVGSSEAIMLAVLALRERWARNSTAWPGDDKMGKVRPNIIITSAAHVCWAKAGQYFGLDVISVLCSDGRFVLDPARAVDLVDEGTIGTTYTGEYEDVAELNRLLIERGLDVPIHVDAASGGFVVSINVSGHKYGLVYPGVGWALGRSAAHLPRDLVFQLSYLGRTQESYTLNFSRGSSHVLAQYYQFVRLGRAGYRRVLEGIGRVATRLAAHLRALGLLVLSRAPGCGGVPIVAFRLDQTWAPRFDSYALSAELEKRGWLVPAYAMADGAQDITLLRVVCRVDFTPQLCDRFADELRAALRHLLAVLPGRHTIDGDCVEPRS